MALGLDLPLPPSPSHASMRILRRLGSPLQLQLKNGRAPPLASTHNRGALPPLKRSQAGALNIPGVVEPVIKLASIRESLIRQEDTIIYELLKRAQLGFNGPTYDEKCFAVPGFRGSRVEFLLKETEHLQAKVGRYQAPDEHPFFPEGLPQPILPRLPIPRVLHPAAESININNAIWRMYVEDLLPKITVPEDDGNYGSASVCDVLCLQALSKRVHYGKFVAEAKFTEKPELFVGHIHAQDGDAILRALTYKSVEDDVKTRVANKARAYGQEVDEHGQAEVAKYKIKPELAGALYEDWVMPLTKQVQVMYLLRRLD